MNISIWAIAFLIGCVVAITARYLKNKSQQKQSSQVTEQLANNPAALEKLRSSLYHLYSNHVYPEGFNLNTFMQTLDTLRIDYFKINMVYRITDTEFVLVTTCTDKDYDVGLGTFGDVKKIYNLNFRVVLNPQKKLVEVFSNYFENNTTKGLRSKFGGELLDGNMDA